jgi:molybdopterin-containing oxidoreductase family iron-sulfur binding subunit
MEAIRSRLAGSQGRLYWRSLGELADTPQFREYLHREFPEQASEWNDPKGRRQFLRLMGASLALAGVGACTKQPPEEIVPYVRQPENLLPGRPLFFASAIPLNGFAQAVLVESHMGRPTKIEGNPDHPASLGATDVLTQAAVLGLYDPDRAQTIQFRGEVKTWAAFTAALQSALGAQKGKQGSGLRLLTGSITSPALADIVSTILRDYPQAKWHQFDPVSRDQARVSTGEAAPAEPIYHFDKADVVVTLESDFLTSGPGSVRYQKDFAGRRRVRDQRSGAPGVPAEPAGGAGAPGPGMEMNRLYAIESTPTLTGAKADHRLTLQSREIESAARALASAVGAAGGAAGTPGTPEVARFVAAVAKDLQAHKGRAVVVPGEHQPASVHALALAMNQALGNAGTTVTYGAALDVSPSDPGSSLAELARAMDGGQVELLIVLGANPVYSAPADLKFGEKFAKVALAVYHGLYADETANLCHWNVAGTHPLESWGDSRTFDGTVTLTQPLIAPLYDGYSEYEVLSAVAGQPVRRTLQIVKDYWTKAFAGGSGWTIADAAGQPFKDAETFWRRAVHDGFIRGTAIADGGPATPFAGATAAAASPAAAAAPPQEAQAAGLEIIFRPDPTVWDGRFANNGWLQELPKPLTKVTWDTAAWISPALARERDLEDGDLIELRYRGRTTRLPIFRVPGHPDRSVTVFLGYGRLNAGRVGTAAKDAEGFNAYLLRTSDAPWFGSGLEISKVGGRYLLATTQEHHLMEGRAPVRVATIEEYKTEPEIIAHMGEKPPRTLTMYPDHPYNGYKWGMAIDLNSCTGCGACTIACVAENNIPVVGKNEVAHGREMHWIRVDHYFSGDADHPESYHQPVPCMHCENAPCEVVCPVAATTHSSEGLNDMVYNRCVGTRYCSNNCPYKVRRFNFLLYSDWTTKSYEPLRNPDVTVRARGVMEKCTYCVQRINQARVDSKREDRSIRDNEIVTACQGVCPSDAIVFGNLNDPNSQVSKLQAEHRNYGILEDLNTRPRTTYLAALRNPNPELEPAQNAGRPTAGH